MAAKKVVVLGNDTRLRVEASWRIHRVGGLKTRDQRTGGRVVLSGVYSLGRTEGRGPSFTRVACPRCGPSIADTHSIQPWSNVV